ncbi:tetratricopeptide repeat protein [Labrenzia sp. R4_2]|uniref:tetratricopeptide repeat protein n=1 Tax=Labrenzia sp. R4_2 TaxID=2821107 RepID=UPI001ADAA3B0|nr:tetratricopeptide repeat protein [Labrenzia sp. R4_2]
MFATFLFLSPVVGLAQPVPDLGPETDAPSIDDFDALPDAEPDEGGQVVVEETDPGETLSKLDSLYEDLAGAEDPAARQRVARDIRRIWMDSGSDTVDLLMARAGRAIQAEDHGLALDLLDVVVVLEPSFAEGWNRRATVHYMKEDFGKSLVDIERTLALEPRHWGALSGLAIIQRRLGFEEQALSTFRRALKIHPGLENASEAVESLEKEAEGEPV